MGTIEAAAAGGNEDPVKRPGSRIEAENVIGVLFADVQVAVAESHVATAIETSDRHEVLEKRSGGAVILIDCTCGRPRERDRVEIAVRPERRHADGSASDFLDE